MILISTIEHSIVISSDRVIKDGIVEVEKIRVHKNNIVSVSDTDFIRIPVKEKGRYKVKVKFEGQQCSKTINVF